jgi:hypothetical protein
MSFIKNSPSADKMGKPPADDRVAAAELALPSLAAQLVEAVIQAVCGRGSGQRPLSVRMG